MEYIAIKKPNFIGIKYISTHHDPSKNSYSQLEMSSLEKMINYAIPAVDSNSGFNTKHDRELMDKFPNTAPICYENIEKIKPNITADHRSNYPVNMFGVKHLPEYKYRMSIYGIIEDELKKMPIN